MLMVFKLNRNCTFVKNRFKRLKNVGPIDTMKSTRRLRNLNVCRATASVPLNLVFCSDSRSHTTRRPKPFNNT